MTNLITNKHPTFKEENINERKKDEPELKKKITDKLLKEQIEGKT